MTTIALGVVDKRLHLCADTQVGSGSSIVGYAPKIFRTGYGLAALAGDLGPAHEVLRWIRGGAKPKKKPVFEAETDITVLWVRGLLDIVEFDRGLFEIPVDVPYTAGSGRDFALAALQCGKTPREAVALACNLDCFSGGSIDELIL